jgi:ABC-2 type transport system ATP-binding protein
MKLLLDLAAADSGTATIGERRYRELRDPVRTVGAVLEPNAFHPGRSGRNHLRVLADAAGIRHARVDAVLEMTGIAGAADRRVGAYSLGMRQRLSLAAALLGDPPVLVLDEPGNGLDPQGIHDLRTLLRTRAAQGHTVFVSSHLLAEVEQLVDDLVVVDRGRLVTTGALQDLQHDSVTVRSPNASALARALVWAGASVEPVAADTLRVQGMATADIGDMAHDARIPLHELVAGPGSLEDLFLGWTSHASPPFPAQSAPSTPESTEKEVVPS